VIKKIKFLNKSVYPGGNIALNSFIKKNLQYPNKAIKNNTEGKVYLKFKINPNGKVYDVILLKGIGNGCDEEAIRLVKLLIYTKPKNHKLKVTTYKKLNITFKLPPPKKKERIQIKYTMVK
tara:strand:- start:747 stop:1109 length:363 start_codon:yes stop_codon:yes gene_type:complete